MELNEIKTVGDVWSIYKKAGLTEPNACVINFFEDGKILKKLLDRITELEGQRDRALDNLEYEYKQRLKNAETQFKQLEGQRNLLFAATEEMLNLIESSDFDNIDGAPNNDDMNRWHRALQI